ncbi:hypothetical protein OCUBac02_40570 [Bosea sp. ANAM02]|nr:hypothetical protein OCUBac02_40570 [Bosea sp. ANAM02]
MENEFRSHLLAVAALYASAAGCALSTVSRRCRNDSSFFERIADPAKSFTARTYDEVVTWFEMNWPEGAPKPPPLRIEQPAA